VYTVVPIVGLQNCYDRIAGSLDADWRWSTLIFICLDVSRETSAVADFGSGHKSAFYGARWGKTVPVAADGERFT
jgi:hypothetical protein